MGVLSIHGRHSVRAVVAAMLCHLHSLVSSRHLGATARHDSTVDRLTSVAGPTMPSPDLLYCCAEDNQLYGHK